MLVGCTSGEPIPDTLVEQPDPLLDCRGYPTGSVKTTAGAIIYHDKTLSGAAAHATDTGCLTALDITLKRDGGCAMSLTFATTDGAWTLTSGEFTADPQCGDDWSDSDFGVYNLDATASTGGLIAPPTVAAPGETTCLDESPLALLGNAVFVDGDRTIEVQLPGLKLAGGVRSNAADSAQCPAEPITCEGVVCATDSYGMECGGCAQEQCPPAGPYGLDPGDILQDVELLTCDGQPVRLHDLCGADTGYIALFADWCPTCAKFIAQMSGVYKAHADEGLSAIAVLISDAQGDPPTALACKQWQEDKDLTMTVVYDPLGKMEIYGKKETTVVTDRDARIVHRSTGTSPWELEKIIVEVLSR